jgi:GWxTD domain-containing protein
MMRFLWFLSFLLLTATEAMAIRVTFDYRVFHLPGEGPYVEFMTAFEPASMKPIAGDGGQVLFQAELTLIVSQNGQVIDFRKVRASSDPVGEDLPANMLSVERFFLKNGRYSLELKATDIGNPDDPGQTYVQEFAIDNLSEGAFVSDIEFVSAYTPTAEPNAFSKSGYDILPYLSSYFPTDMTKLVFYAEIYQTHNYFGEGAAFASSVCITDALNREIAECKRIRREKAAPVVPMLQSLDISNLPTGDYKLRIEVRDRENNLVVARERKFARNFVVQAPADPTLVPDDVIRNSFAARYTNRDSLYAILQSHLPAAESIERTTIDYRLGEADLAMLQSFFYSFWQRRSPGDPEGAWRAYEKQLAIVESNFATKIRRGWQTDRGRVYLQYGPPSSRVVRNHDPDYWPFEIWHYYETNTGLHDRRFLFINTSLNTDMELLHSDVPDEVQNNDWKQLVRSRQGNNPAVIGRNANNQMVDPYSGDELQDLWYNPR